VEIFLVGTSHAVASARMRERMHVDVDEMYTALAPLCETRAVLHEAVPLATCGRLELYGVAPDADRAVRLLGHLMVQRTGIDREELRRHSYVYRDSEAVRHLLRVASGLDSVIHGEAQILGQVRAAAHHPRVRDTAGPVLHRLFQRALRTGKRVRSETGIGRGAASLASASVTLLEREIGDLSEVSALVLGAGDTGALMARLLRKAGVGRLVVANRTLATAEEVARELGIEACDLGSIGAALSGADLVVGAVATDEPLVTPELIRDLPADRRPRYFLDLAHPRNFDPRLSELPGTTVFDLEHVFGRVEAAREARAAHLPRARLVIDEEVRAYETWYRSRDSATVVEAVRRRMLDRAMTEAERHVSRVPDDQKEQMRRLARSVARAILHQPTVALRDVDASSERGRVLLEHASKLFGVDEVADDELPDPA
jgi:glutamyl-tRNA reductase